MKKFFVTVAVLALVCSTASAQNFLDRLKDRAKEAAEQNISNKVEKGVNDLLDGNFGKKKDKKDKKADESAKQEASGTWTCEECGKTGNTGKFCADCGAKKPGASEVPAAKPAASAAWTCEECGKTGNTGNFCDDCGAKKPSGEAAPAPKPKKQVETAYAKSDFVPGDEIFFEDTFENEQLGEFPSQWDLMSGYAEVGSVGGRKVIAFTDDGFADIQPLMNDQQHFLPDVFTLEFDMYLQTGDGLGGDELEIAFGNPDLPNWNGRVEYVVVSFRDDGYSRYGWTVQKPNGGDDITGEQ